MTDLTKYKENGFDSATEFAIAEILKQDMDWNYHKSSLENFALARQKYIGFLERIGYARRLSP